MNYLTLVRVGIFVAIVVLAAPVAINAATYEDDPSGERVDADFGGRNDTLFVTTQGTETLNGSKAKAVAIDTASGEVVWSHTRYERYFDVEPISDDEVFFLGAVGPHGSNMWATIVNWRTGERVTRFRIPDDTHDVDPFGDGKYAVADIENDRVYVYDAVADEVVWQYRFRDHFPSEAGGDEDDYTHLNDVDVFDDGETLLVSPRNFDRVMLLDRSEKRVEWTLGEEDDYDVLYEQHNPSLLSRDPPTVLVADSENDRVVEYRKNGSAWEQVWAYRGSLTWPREADRLPNGNTLVVDSNGQRVLEVTPGREVVWETTITKNPYDADFRSLGDEPTGPSMVEFQQEFDGPEAETGEIAGLAARLTYPVELLQWVVPWNVRLGEFLNLSLALMLGAFAAGGEIARLRTGYRRSPGREWLPSGTASVGFGVVAFAVGSYLFAAPGVGPGFEWAWQGVGLLTGGVGVISAYEGRIARFDREPEGGPLGRAKGPLGVAVLCTFGALGLVVTTGWLGLNLGIAAVFAVEAVRQLRTDASPNRPRLGRLSTFVGYGGRLATLVPAVVLVIVGTGNNYENVYFGVSALLLCSAVAPRSRTVLDSPATTFGLRSYVLGGLRAVFAVGAIVTTAGLVYLGLQPSALAPVYLGLSLPVARITGILLASIDGR